MPTTAKGFPYPSNTDPLGDLAELLEDLATFLNTSVGVSASGQASINIVTAGTAESVDISFPVGRFTAAPKVTASVEGSAPGQVDAIQVANVTATGCRFWGRRSTGTADLDVHWIARQ